MTNEDIWWEAQEGVSCSLFNSFPLSWSDVRSDIEKLKRSWFRHIAALVIKERYGEKDRLLARAWLTRLKEYSWGAMLTQYEGGESDFSNFAEIEMRLTEAGLSGRLVGTAIRRAISLSRFWPDGPALTEKEMAPIKEDIRKVLQVDMKPAWEDYTGGIMNQEMPIRPVLPTFGAATNLLKRFEYPISRAGVEFLGRALPNPPLRYSIASSASIDAQPFFV